MSRKQQQLPSDIKAARDRIEHWRRTRVRRCRMPEELWEEAAALARKHGVHPVARGLRISYDSLKQRSLRPSARVSRPMPSESEGFVELTGSQLLSSTGMAATDRLVELSDSDGSRLTIRLANQDSLDVAGLVQAFWCRQR